MMQETLSQKELSTEKTRSSEDVLLEHSVPLAEYMYGCTPTAVAMLLGYYDLYGYRGKSFSNLIEGDVLLNERGLDDDAYNMNAFDTALGRAIATEDYVHRFYERDGVETTPEQELEYSFVDGGTQLDTSIWNCLADYLGTGQYWRGMSNRATRLTYESLEVISLSTRTETISGDGYTRTIEDKYLSFLYGVQLYVQSKGYSLDNEITGSYMVDGNSGDFTFSDYMAEIDAGRPVLISITGHTMIGYGYNEETQEIIFDDTYLSDCRMSWGGSYFYAGKERKQLSVTVISLVYSDLNCDLAVGGPAGNGGLVVSDKKGATDDADYLVAGGQLFVNFAVTNKGSDACEAFDMAIYLDGEKVKTIAVDGLAAGERRSFQNVELDALAAGNHVLKVVADDANIIQETSGLNNSLAKKVFVLSKKPTVVSTTSSLPAGNSLDNVFVTGGGALVVKGGHAADCIVQGKVLSYDPATAVYEGYPAEMTVSSGGVASNVQICEFGTLVVGNGGLAENVELFDLGLIELQEGGIWRGGRIGSGGILEMEGGRVEDVEISHDVSFVADAGMFSGVYVEGALRLQGESSAEAITVGRGGTVTAVNGRHIDGAVVNAGGLLDLKTSATVSDLRVENGADVKCSDTASLEGELTLAGTLGTLGTLTGDCVAGVEKYLFIVTEEDGHGSIQFYKGGFAADSVITIEMEDVEGDFALAYGTLAALASATITVKRGGEAKELDYNGKKVWEDGNRVSLEADGKSWMLRVVPCLSNVVVTAPDAQAQICVSFSCVDEMTGRFFSWNGGDWTAFNGEELFFTENGTLQLRVDDGADVVLYSDVFTLNGFNLLLTEQVQNLPDSGMGNALLLWGTDAAWVDLCNLEIYLDGRCLLLEGLSDKEVELRNLSATEASWRVKPVQSEIWTESETPLVTAALPSGPQVVQAEDNGILDVILACSNGVWEKKYAAHYACVEELRGIVQNVPLMGMNRISDAFFGSSDATRLYLTDEGKGDALFVDDLYSVRPSLEWDDSQSRISKLNEIFAGAGEDVIDMTSEQIPYDTDRLIIRGGDGDDIIWGSRNANLLFGDEGNDELVGGPGDDVLVGGTGVDEIYGGGGNDIIAFCAGWGTDKVVQLSGTIKLWFESGSLENWNEETLTYTDGDNSVSVSGIGKDSISLVFGENGNEAEYANLAAIGAFAPFTTQTIYKLAGEGFLA